jgi:membrane protease YdiL (CAAX protease family)
VFHIPGWLYYGLGTFQNALAVFVVGLLAGVLMWRTKSLWSAVCFHALNNLAALAIK